MTYAFPPPPTIGIPVRGTDQLFPVHRIYCVGRNYEDHAKEMGFTGREPPFFFMKPADALLVVRADETGTMTYPTLTHDLHHEVELVVAIGRAGRGIKSSAALEHVFGYAVGLDMTRRDLQGEMKKQGRPWSIGKAFEQSAPIGPISTAADVPDIRQADISLSVNDKQRQHSNIDKLIWTIEETIEHLSSAWDLQAGDLIFTGTPQGVGSVVVGDLISASISALPTLRLRIGGESRG